jgi:phage gpG-like protein
LQDSIRATTSGNKGIVRSPLPYAAVHEYGGTIYPHGGPVTIRRSEYVGLAMERNQEKVMRALETGFAAVARRNGW